MVYSTSVRQTRHLRHLRWVGLMLLSVIGLGLMQAPLVLAQNGQTDVNPGSEPHLTPSLIESKIKEVEASRTLEPETIPRLVEQYRSVLSRLEETRVHQAQKQHFQESINQAPEETARLRAEIAELAARAPPSLPDTISLEEIEHRLTRELADIAALESRVAELSNIIEDNRREPSRARQRIVEANQALESINAELNASSTTARSSLEQQARRWALEARRDMLRAELLMLDQQLLSAPARAELNLTRRDLAERQLARARILRALLENGANRLRSLEAERVKSEIAEVESGLGDAHPLERELADENAQLSLALSELTARLGQLDRSVQSIDERRLRIEEDFRSARQRLEATGLSRALGQTLINQFRQLPDSRAARSQANEVARRIGETNLNLIRYRDQLRMEKRIAARMENAVDELPAEEQTDLRRRLGEQWTRQEDLLRRLISLEENHLRGLNELEDSTRSLHRIAEEYRKFLSQRLLWVRSVVPLTQQSFGNFPLAVTWLVAAENWQPVPGMLWHELQGSPLLWIGLPLVALLLWQGPMLRRQLRATAEPLRRVSQDRFIYTLKALGLTLLIALPGPLLLLLLGMGLAHSLRVTPFSEAIGGALVAIGGALYYLQAFYVLCLPGGLADRHFRWSSQIIARLRAHFAAASLILPALGVVTGATLLHPDANISGTLGRLALVALIAALAVLTVRLTNPWRGVFSGYLTHHPKSWFNRLRWLWFPVLIAVPIVLVLLALLGYVYTAAVLFRSLINELWLILSLIVLHQLIVRWLLVTRRSLALRVALEQKRQDAAADSGGDNLISAAENVDLAALDEQTRRLINSLIVIAGTIGLWLIWSDVLPALSLLDSVTLWYYSGHIDGLPGEIPVTVADLTLLLFIVTGAAIAAKNLPALLEIILLRHSQITPGARYTIITLTSYSITTFAVLLVFGTLGLTWSQLQWLVAALGVGIGFGLQEIVANFISGLIILFERPIRVGDVVTVGDTTGTVTRIQIRATTIRNWDRQELLVPNKEFITARLLNWSLTDTLNRMTMVVGVKHGTDTGKALALMAEAAAENPRVLEDPAPVVTFEAFGEHSLTLVLRYFLGVLDCRLSVSSELHQAIDEKFRAAGICIAYPQRDLHLHAAQPIPVASSAGRTGRFSLRRSGAAGR